MMRVEAIIFAAREPVPRDQLSRVVGRDCNLDLLIADIREELKARPYDIMAVAGGFQHRTRKAYADVIRASSASLPPVADLGTREAAVLMAIAYFQPVTRTELSRIFGREIGREVIAALRQAGFVSAGPRSPAPGAPYTFVTTRFFLSAFGFQTLRDLPDIEMLEDAGLLSRRKTADEGDLAPEGDEAD
nr:SMC-Scp complex subunit ScpB [Gellertiella hungarica]